MARGTRPAGSSRARKSPRRAARGDALFAAAGNPPGHPEHAKLEARLSLKPGHFLLVAQLATPDGRGWLETRELPYVTTTQLAVDPLKQAALEQLASGLVSR